MFLLGGPAVLPRIRMMPPGRGTRPPGPGPSMRAVQPAKGPVVTSPLGPSPSPPMYTGPFAGLVFHSRAPAGLAASADQSQYERDVRLLHLQQQLQLAAEVAVPGKERR